MSGDERRLTPTERLHEVTMAALGTPRRASFGITEERGPGGVVLPLFRGDVPVCDEFPTAQAALAGLFAAHAQFLTLYPRTAQEGAGNGR